MSATPISHDRSPGAAQEPASSRGAIWFDALTGNATPAQGYPTTLLVADAPFAGSEARFISVVPDANHAYPRVRKGETGVIEGWAIAQAVHEVIAADQGKTPRPIIAIVDVASQAYGRREEALGLHQSLAGAAGAYAEARLAGHPVIALLVGKAMSGAFLAHGYQANRLIALDDVGVQVHAMGKSAAARITMRSVEDLERLAATVPPMAYDISAYATLGLLWRLVEVSNAQQPGTADLAQVDTVLRDALADIQADPTRGLASRLGAENRQASARVRAKLRAQW
ncbi:biotin-independent malonate decarboxylase subunit gamma [Pigmentiphaga aceris]|uniref:Biotin-independent malonate decarboxylase subunit gamma n=1 Tax=Pigmentiphaga aceris TaxID=1940612 RepID=A0A5C0B1F0_9BURK|nr:biotin-independent malonate decarboxylase subunit gamma [Pigmentiphaga aceris]QEI07593.1 biotin-independent malonate decarboxylase subunit gamma [Pigmentiphaga aceris]